MFYGARRYDPHNRTPQLKASRLPGVWLFPWLPSPLRNSQFDVRPLTRSHETTNALKTFWHFHSEPSPVSTGSVRFDIAIFRSMPHKVAFLRKMSKTGRDGGQVAFSCKRTNYVLFIVLLLR
jgi:hypothetical protein